MDELKEGVAVPNPRPGKGSLRGLSRDENCV